MLDIADSDIGGARVRRTFSQGDRQLRGGDQLTRQQVLDIRLPNRRALADSGFIEIFPLAPSVEPGERFIVGVGKDRYNVIEGRILNKDPLTRDQADKLLRS